MGVSESGMLLFHKHEWSQEHFRVNSVIHSCFSVNESQSISLHQYCKVELELVQPLSYQPDLTSGDFEAGLCDCVVWWFVSGYARI